MPISLYAPLQQIMAQRQALLATDTAAAVQIPRGAENTVALDVILQHIKFRLGSKLTMQML